MLIYLRSRNYRFKCPDSECEYQLFYSYLSISFEKITDRGIKSLHKTINIFKWTLICSKYTFSSKLVFFCPVFTMGQNENWNYFWDSLRALYNSCFQIQNFKNGTPLLFAPQKKKLYDASHDNASIKIGFPTRSKNIFHHLTDFPSFLLLRT